MTGARAGKAGDVFRNPVWPAYLADPFVLLHDGAYYAYGTTLPDPRPLAFDVLRSDDLVHWTLLGGALEPLEDPEMRDYWAPEVAYDEGRFYLYYSAGLDDRLHKVRVAVSDRPEGPFRDAGRILTGDELFAIDASPFRDVDGSRYLFYARDVLEGDRVGTSLAVMELADPLTPAGPPVAVLAPTADWQRFLRDRPMYGGVHDWHTLEGPFVVRRGGRYWCLFSGGNWTGAGYGMSWAVADHPLGPWMEPPAVGPLLLRSLPGVLDGPGHASVVVGPDGADWLVYHAWSEGTRESGGRARRMCIDRLEWTAHGPRTPGPTAGEQRVPRAPIPAKAPSG